MTESTATATPAVRKPGRPKKGEAETPEVDLTGLSFAPAVMPKRPNAVDNVFTVPLGESYETETARATRVPAVALRRVEGLLRRAAQDLEIGVTIAVDADDKGEPIVGEDGTVSITFQGKDRRKRKPKTKAGEDEAGTETSATDNANGSDDPGTAPASDDTDAASVDAEREPAPVAP